jgi:integrase
MSKRPVSKVSFRVFQKSLHPKPVRLIESTLCQKAEFTKHFSRTGFSLWSRRPSNVGTGKDVGLYRRRVRRKNGQIVTAPTWRMRVGGRCESTNTSNKRLAMKILAIRRAALAEGRFPSLLKSHPPMLKDYLEQYLSARTNDIHPNTLMRYKVSQRALDRFFGATYRPGITDARIEDYKTARIRAGSGPAGINRDLSLLRLVLKHARKERYIAQSPLTDREHFMDERKERLQARPFSIEEEQRLLAVAKGYLRPLLVLLLDTGLRPNAEALPLRWKNVDFERGMITVVASKTPAGLRTIPMTCRLKAELLRWKKLTGSTSEFVFFYPRNPAKHLLHVPKTWARALKDANVSKRRLSDCRSTFCSRAYAAGIAPVLIEMLMGHAGNGLVRLYCKADDAFMRDAAAKLETFLTSKTPAEKTAMTTANTWVN